MTRSTPEWKPKSDDAKIPPRVRARVFDRAAGVCHLCKLAIKVPAETWDADHIVALVNGGAHAESNLAPAHKHCHLAKTTLDVADKKKVAKVRKKHIGVTRPAGKLQGRGFPPAEKQPKPLTKALPPRVRDVYGREVTR